MTETTYKCSKCGAEDHDRSETGMRPPALLNCWKCKAGFGKDPEFMMVNQLGMFPIGTIN